MTFRRSRRAFLSAATLFGALASAVSAETQISMGPSAGATNAELEVPILLDSDARIAGLQIEINFDPSVVTIGVPEKVGVQRQFRTVGSVLPSGAYRLLILSEGGDVLPDGRIVNLQVTLKAAVPTGSSAVSMSGVMIADEYGLERNYAMAPYIELVAPNGGMAVDPLNPIPLSTLADFGGEISSVQILANGRVIGSASGGGTPVNWTPEEPGRTRLRVIGTRPDGSKVSAGSVDVNVNGESLDDYDKWKAFYFEEAQAADAEISGALRDPDGDGRNNLREYAEGTKPMEKDAPPVNPSPFFVEDSGQQYFAVRMRRRILVDDVAVRAMESSDLTTPVESAVTDLEEAGNFEVVTFRSVTSLRDAKRGFLQIEVNQPDTP